MASKEATAELLPVIVGGDVGAYALGLEFYQAFGVQSLCVAAAPIDAITKSEIFSVEPIPSAPSDQVRLAVLKGIARANPGKQLIYLANTDMGAAFAAKYRLELEKDYVVPFPDEAAFFKLSRKDSFEQVCKELGVRTPATVVADFSVGIPEVEVPFDFPVVAKAASGDAYDRLSFPGKEKIWFIDSATELSRLWGMLWEAGYREKFLVQELIPGDDSHMRSLTMYVDSQGEITLKAAAQVLLQDPTPTMIGNPVAMITREYPQMWEAARQILQAGNFRGFANFDIKIDPRGGAPVFFEVNPRIGRNSYYVSAAGVNPMEVMVRDLVEGERVPPQVANEKILYSLVPAKVIDEYVAEPELRAEAKALIEAGRSYSPLESQVESGRWRKLILALQKLNYRRKFKRYFRAS